MRHGIMGALLCAALGATAAGATAGIDDQLEAMMTYTSAAGAGSARSYGSYSGVGSLFVSYASTATTGTGGLCTGALVASNVVLTAAHCLYNPSDPVSSITFYLPSLGERTAASTYSVSGFALNPTYDGTLGKGNDLALFTLSTAASGHDVYGIYAGDPLSAFTRVGTGTIGGPGGTGTGGVTQDYDQRIGNNLYEYYGDQVFSGMSHNVLFSDFDDGTAAHDVFGRLGGYQQTGIAGESDSSPGDSGGPEFIDGLIAGVTSFGVSSSAFTGGCGTGYIDPVAANGGSCTNSSVGELAGDTWVQPNSDFVMSYIASAVPEPSAWMTMIAGFGAVGTALRKARTRASAEERRRC